MKDWLKEGEGISQRIYKHDPWTWTMVRGLTVGVGGGKIGTTVITETIFFKNSF